MTQKSEVDARLQSELFSNRLEHVSVVPLAHRVDVDRVLKRNGYRHLKNEYISTTYFSVTPSADIWQWQDGHDTESVVRFRQRHDTSPFEPDGGFQLHGGGDLEIKIHDRLNAKKTKKNSIRIPEEYGIERLIELSNSNPAQFEKDLLELAHSTKLNGLDPRDLVAHLSNGLRALTTKTSRRDIYATAHRNTRVTIDTDNGFYAYPYLDTPVLHSMRVAERTDIAKVDIKFSPSNQIGFDRLIAEIAPFATQETRAETGLTFTQMREVALKKSKTIVKEQSDYEFESKFNIESTDPGQADIHGLIQKLYQAVADGKLPGYQISRYLPYYERRPGETALRTLYGWVDDTAKMHEVLTLIEVDGPTKSYWIKRKGDPETNTDAKTMKRSEKITVTSEKPDMEALIAEEEKKREHPIIALPQFRKDKIAFKVEDEQTGRMFVISLDETAIEGGTSNARLHQMEVEYAETPTENIASIPSELSLKASCDALQSVLTNLRIDGMTITPTNQRKIDWLYEQTTR